MPEGTVIAAHGRQYLVESAAGAANPADQHAGHETPPVLCYPRGKKSEAVCGDRVEFALTGLQPGAVQGVIEKILPRRNLFRRSSEFREKLIAANVEQLVLMVATEPNFNDELLNRGLVAAEAEGVECLILLNKCDIPERLAVVRQQLANFAGIGYTIIEIVARDAQHPGIATLRAHLANKTSILLGQSGMGKSTLINTLYPAAQARTQEISGALDSGKHTTTHATLYRIASAAASPGGSPGHLGGATAAFSLIDSPGLREFGLSHLSRAEISQAFPEFRELLGCCRFRDCRHDHEPGCAIRAALQAGKIHPRRFAIHQAMQNINA